MYFIYIYNEDFYFIIMNEVDIELIQGGVRYNDTTNEYELFLDFGAKNCSILDIKIYNQYNYKNPTIQDDGVSILNFPHSGASVDNKITRWSVGNNSISTIGYSTPITNNDFTTLNYDLNINTDLIIVSVHLEPNEGFDTCSDYRVFPIYNKAILKLEAMAGVREIVDTCTIPRRFIDFIIKQKAIDLAEQNKDVDLLCKYFLMFSNSIGTNKIEYAPCGCLKY